MTEMKVFIGWSGEVSKYVGEALRDLLPQMDHAVHPWLSPFDIGKGERWREKVDGVLSDADTKAGVFCVTPENFNGSWMLWESGYLTGRGQIVCPYAFGYKSATDVPEPWASLQVTVAEKDDTLKLVEALCKLHDGDLERCRRSFDKFWPDLEAKLSAPPSKREKVEKPQHEKIDEILERVRLIDTRLSEQDARAGYRQSGAPESVMEIPPVSELPPQRSETTESPEASPGKDRIDAKTVDPSPAPKPNDQTGEE